MTIVIINLESRLQFKLVNVAQYDNQQTNLNL